MFSAAEVAQFDRDGYVVVRELAARDECAAIKSIAERDLAAHNAARRVRGRYEISGRAGVARCAGRAHGAPVAAGVRARPSDCAVGDAAGNRGAPAGNCSVRASSSRRRITTA